MDKVDKKEHLKLVAAEAHKVERSVIEAFQPVEVPAALMGIGTMLIGAALGRVTKETQAVMMGNFHIAIPKIVASVEKIVQKRIKEKLEEN